MNQSQVEHLEFIGGPEDGLLVDSAFLARLMVKAGEHGETEIPMFIRLERELTTEKQGMIELVLIGYYVCDDPERERLQYHWVG